MAHSIQFSSPTRTLLFHVQFAFQQALEEQCVTGEKSFVNFVWNAHLPLIEQCGSERAHKLQPSAKP